MRLSRFMTLFVATTSVFLLSACSTHHATQQNTMQPMTEQQENGDVSRHYPMPDFSKVENDGDLDIELRTANTSEVVVIGPADYADRIVPSLSSKNFLTIAVSGQAALPPHAVRVIICSPRFTHIRQEGHGAVLGDNVFAPSLLIEARSKGNITLNDINSDALTISNMGSGNISLSGIMNVEEIAQTGSGNINLHWVDSDVLRIHASGTGIITLAGVAKNVNAVLYNNAMLDSKYLRTERSYINALDYSSAHISPVETLNAFATNHGSIYFYKDPKHLAEYSADVGGVMRMVGISDKTYDS